jgi:hypothetical protein
MEQLRSNLVNEQPEYAEIYGDKTRTELVTKIYTNLFERAPDAAGLEYWVNGDGSTVNADQLIVAFLNAATTDDQAVVENKLEVANHYTAELGGADTFDKAEAATYIADVDGTDASVTSAKADIDAAVPVSGETFTLTTSTDKLVAADYELADGETEEDVVRTTDGNDTIDGVASALVAEATFEAADTIDGGAGDDTLNVDLNANFTGMTTGSVANVENIVLTNDTVIARTFDATGVTGATNYTLDSAKGINLTDLESTGLTIAEKGTQSNVSIAFATGVKTSGTTDAMSLELDGVGAAKTDSAAQVNPTVTLAGIEVLDVEATGSESFVDLSTVTDLTTLTLTGDQDLTVTDVASKVTSVDASAATGDLDLALSVGTASAVTSVKAGSGDDTVAVDANDLQANAVVEGGLGEDTLKLEDSAAAGSTIQLSQSGFETLQLTGVATGQTLTVSGTNTTDVATVQLDADSTDDGAVNLVNMGAADYAVNVVGGAAAGQALTIDNSGTATVSVDVTAKQATAAAKATGTTTTSASAVTASNAATADFTVGQYVTQSGDFVANKASSVTLNVETGKNGATTPVELTEFSGDLDAAKATNVTVNADGKLNAAEVNAAAASSAVINTGTTASTADLILTKATDLQLTSKGDFTVLAANSDLDAVQSATISTDGAMLVDTTLADVASMTISGSNAKSAFDNNAKTVGGTAMDHTLTVTATGLKAGFTLDGTIASAQAITIDSSDVTGTQAIGTTITGSDVTLTSSGATKAVTYGDIEAATDGSGTATVNAAGNTGNIVVGTIGATTQHKTVSVDVSGALGTVGVGAIVSDGSVTVDAEDSLKAVTLNDGAANGAVDISAVTGINVNAGLTALAFDGAILNDATKAFTGEINGSIEADTYQFAAANDAKADITFTGDMGLGTDSIVIDATAVTTSSNTVKVDISGLTNYDAATINGGAGDDTITGGADVDTITGGTGADSLTGGAGADVFTFTAGDSLVASYDKIADFAKGSDVIDHSVALSLGGDATTAAAAGNALISAGGKASFHADDDTFAEKVAAVAADLNGATATTAGEVAFFEDGGNTYVFITDATDVDTNGDDIIELTGVTGLSTISVDASSDITIA